MNPLLVPTAKEPRVDQADWVELSCILSNPRGSMSMQDVIGAFRQGGTVQNDWGSDGSESIAQAVFSELDNRQRACGKENYPFNLDAHAVEIKPDYAASPYVFQLLLTHYGIVKPAGMRSPERLFEEMSAHAAGQYFGGPGTATSLAFGFPRRYDAKSFHKALNDLCSKLGEGEGASLPEGEEERRKRLAKLQEQKDGKLDIVAWRAFPDRRAGKLIGFGQCACGKTDWRTKFAELQPDAFFKRWLRKAFVVDPVRMFFVPRRIEHDDWADVAAQAGLLFDRCRIAHHAAGLPADIASACETWSKYVLANDGSTPKKRTTTGRRGKTGR
jgi:hypothetical protein